MNAPLWRSLALAALAVGTALVCYQQTLPGREDFGLHFSNARGSLIPVTSVDPNSPAAAAGIRAGDTLSFGDSAAERAKVLYATGGSRVSVLANGSRRVSMTARTFPPQQSWPPFAIRLAFLLIAGFLAWRRPDDAATRALVVFLGCYGVAISLENGLLPSPLLTLLVLQILAGMLFLIGTAAAAWFAAAFPSGSPHPLTRGIARAAAVAAAIGIAAISIGEFFQRTTLAVNDVLLGTFAFIGLCVLATLAAAYALGAADERQRRRWVFLILAAGLAGPLVDVVLQGVYGFVPLVDELSIVSLALLPIGLAYVILRHRVIDVGFVINRAVVYTAVSLIIVAVFLIVETLLAKYVEGRNHVESVAVQLAVALALGFSIRAIHNRVDRVVDSVLFRERHLDEAALRFFAHDAPYITDASILVARCVKTVERHAHARGAGIWTPARGGYAPFFATFPQAAVVDENDPAVVAMRARREVVDVGEAESALPGAIAFPMIVRGELAGLLVCGPKRDDESYDPDERMALASLASGVGHALDAIEVRSLRRRLEDLAATDQGRMAF